MKLEIFRYFEEVCKLNSFTRAADLNFISQSTISKYISEIESFFGTQLIKREKFSKKFEITSNGKKVLDLCIDVNRELENLMDCLAEMQISSKLKLGIPPLAGNNFLKKYMISLFTEIDMKNYNVEVQETTVEGLREGLINESLDFAITYYLYSTLKDTNLNTINLCSIEFEIFGVKSEIDNIDKEYPIKNLNNKIILSLQKGTVQYNLIHHIMDRYKIRPKKIIYVDTFELIQELLMDGIGISIFAIGSFSRNTIIKSVLLKSDITLKICFEYYKYKELSLLDENILLLMNEIAEK